MAWSEVLQLSVPHLALEMCRDRCALKPGTALHRGLTNGVIFMEKKKRKKASPGREIFYCEPILHLLLSHLQTGKQGFSFLFFCLKILIHLKCFCCIGRFWGHLCGPGQPGGLQPCHVCLPEARGLKPIVVWSRKRSINDLQRKNSASSVDRLFICDLPASLKFFAPSLFPSASHAFPAVYHHSTRPATCQHQQLCSHLLLVFELLEF